MLEKVRGYHPTADTDLIQRAYAYSARKHDGQLRKSGEPYVTHPLSVADIIADMRLDPASVCAAMLHDTVEDTDATDAEITKLFGEEVAFLVDGVTKLGRVNFVSKEDQQAESFRKMLVAMARDIRVLLVKLADRLDNMRTLEHMKIDSQERIARETLEIYAPLAGRLGIQWLKSELEDLSFKHLQPDAFRELSEKADTQSRDLKKYVHEVTIRIESMLAENGIKGSVRGRTKHLYSVWKKMRQYNCDFEQIHDFVAFRVLVDSLSDCYAALGIVHSQWTPVPGRFKDYIALPKPNMYQSLHTSVIGPSHRRIEVQMRTNEMHRTAEYGIAAHWQYKERSGFISERDAKRFAWLRQLAEFQHDVPDPAEFIESVKGDLFAEEVYVFTPKGDVRVFPRGASPIDFAYSVHSEIGEHCVGARVNGAIVPLRHKLKNGDIVEILTNPNQRPNKDWIDWAATGRARAKIRGYVRTEERKRGLKLGRDLLEREMHKKDVSFQRALKGGELEKILPKLHVQSLDELFIQIGYGKVQASGVVAHLVAGDNTNSTTESLRPGFLERTVRKVTGKEEAPVIRIDELDNVLVRFAKCCSPVQGDPVTGWITRGRGVTVHRRECSKALELDPARRVDVTWSATPKLDRPVTLRIVTADRPGILARLSNEFTQRGVNISKASSEAAGDSQAIVEFQFKIQDLSRLRTLMRALQKIDGVLDVERA